MIRLYRRLRRGRHELTGYLTFLKDPEPGSERVVSSHNDNEGQAKADADSGGPKLSLSRRSFTSYEMEPAGAVGALSQSLA